VVAAEVQEIPVKLAPLVVPVVAVKVVSVALAALGMALQILVVAVAVAVELTLQPVQAAPASSFSSMLFRRKPF
jgi:hypothetical protein